LARAPAIGRVGRGRGGGPPTAAAGLRGHEGKNGASGDTEERQHSAEQSVVPVSARRIKSPQADFGTGTCKAFRGGRTQWMGAGADSSHRRGGGGLVSGPAGANPRNNNGNTDSAPPAIGRQGRKNFGAFRCTRVTGAGDGGGGGEQATPAASSWSAPARSGVGRVPHPFRGGPAGASDQGGWRGAFLRGP